MTELKMESLDRLEQLFEQDARCILDLSEEERSMVEDVISIARTRDRQAQDLVWFIKRMGRAARAELGRWDLVETRLETALEYLERNGLGGTPLRQESIQDIHAAEAAEQVAEAVDENFKKTLEGDMSTLLSTKDIEFDTAGLLIQTRWALKADLEAEWHSSVRKKLVALNNDPTHPGIPILTLCGHLQAHMESVAFKWLDGMRLGVRVIDMIEVSPVEYNVSENRIVTLSLTITWAWAGNPPMERTVLRAQLGKLK